MTTHDLHPGTDEQSTVPSTRTNPTDDTSTGWQVAGDAAETYERELVPPLTAEWSDRALDAAGAGVGARILDVACGTGVVARAGIDLGCIVSGVDNNAGMLDVARRLAPRAEFFEASAGSLPFADRSFDAAIMQFGLMFVPDRPAAVAEMSRVVDHGGAVVAIVWAEIGLNPGYRALAEVLDELAGDHAAMFRSPFGFGDPAAVRATFEAAGLCDIEVETIVGVARFDSVQAMLRGEIGGSPLARHLSADDPELIERATQALSEYVLPDGRLEFSNPAVLARGRQA